MSDDLDNQQSLTTALAPRPVDLVPGIQPMARALAAAASAEIQARFVMARSNPRHWPQVRTKLLELVRMPSFAEASWFRVPRGKKKGDDGKWVQAFAEGFSIRFAEAAQEIMGNSETKVSVIYEDDDVRIISVRTTDYENNMTLSTEIAGRKRTETKWPRDGQDVISERVNTQGEKVFTVTATDDRVDEMLAAKAAKAKRNQVVAMLRTDLRLEMRDEVAKTKTSEARQQIDGLRKRAKEWAERSRISDADLTEYLGCSVMEAGPDLIDELRSLSTAITDGASTWAEALAAKREFNAPAVQVVDEPRTKTKGADAVRAAVEAATGKAQK